MNREIHQLSMQHLVFQRNVLLALSFLLSLSFIVLTLVLFLRKEKVVVVPHALTESVWIQGSQVSESYLKQQAEIVSLLLLNKTPHSVQERGEALLAMTAPSLYGTIKTKLLEEKTLLLEQGASYLFVPSQTLVDPSSLLVEVLGDRYTYISGKLVSTDRESYSYAFISDGQKLLLKGIERKEVG